MVKQIQCGHCGGTHPSVAEIRSCSAGHRLAATAAIPPDLEVNSLRPTPLEPIGLAPDWSRLVGPAGLGRSVVVGAGQEALRIPYERLDDPAEVLPKIRKAQTLAEASLRPVALLLGRDLMMEE